MAKDDITLKKYTKRLKTLQKQEINAVKMYRELATRFDDEYMQETFFDLAASEGKHAAMCKARTQIIVRPKSAMKNAVVFMLKACGKKATLKTIARVEKFASKIYRKIEVIFPEFSSVAEDEMSHSIILRELVNYKPAERAD